MTELRAAGYSGARVIGRVLQRAASVTLSAAGQADDDELSSLPETVGGMVISPTTAALERDAGIAASTPRIKLLR